MKKINSVSQFIILMKKKGFNLWYTVDFYNGQRI